MVDEEDPSLGPESLQAMRPDLVISCGDLPFDYLEYLVTAAAVPLVFVRGNHDPDRARTPGLFAEDAEVGRAEGPGGCLEVDGGLVEAAGLVIGGLGGSMRYRRGPNRYTEGAMRRRAARLSARAFLRGRRSIDVLVTHAPPRGIGDGDDPAHVGFAVFHRLVGRHSPKILVHGHVHPYGPKPPERRIGDTRVINAVGHRVIDVNP